MDYPVTFVTGQAYKPHHSYIWLGPLTAVVAVLLATVASNVPSLVSLAEWMASDEHPSILVAVLVFVLGLVGIYAVVTVVYVLAWRNFSYVFDETEFSLYSGIVTKKRVHVPYARVQSVNHRAGLVQRLFGVCTVSIDTAGGASNKAVRVPYVALADAERIRADLFVRKAAVEAGAVGQVRLVDHQAQAAALGAQQAGIFDTAAQRASAPVSPQQMAAQHAAQRAQPEGARPNLLDEAAQPLSNWRGAFGGAVPGMEPVSFAQRLSSGQLLLTGTTAGATEGTVVSLGITGLVLGALANAGVMEAWMVGLGAVMALGMLALGAATGVLATVLSFANFQVRRRGSRIEVERGLLQRVFSGIDVERIQSVVVKQSFVRRCLGYCEVSLGRINAVSGDASSQQNKQALNQGGLVVHPFVRLDQVDQFLAQLLPEFADMPHTEDLAPLPDVALRRGLVRQGLWRNPLLYTAAGYGAFQRLLHLALGPWAAADAEVRMGMDALDSIGLVVYGFAVLYTAVVLANAVLWKKGSGHALSERFVAVRNDGLHTDFTAIPRTKVQSGFTRTNPFQRAAGVTTLVATTAAGTRQTDAVLWDVTAAQGQAWLDWLKPRHAGSATSLGSSKRAANAALASIDTGHVLE